ncbi:MAG: hypothetical protein ABSB35_35885 [Bryobacteraceae bacterium]|jgi:hypothetical protein
MSVKLEGYSAVVLSKMAEIRSLQPFAWSSPLQNDILLDRELFLASVSEEWTPKVVVVRHGSALAGVVYAKDRGIFRGLRLVYADLTFPGALPGDPVEQQNTYLVALETLLSSTGTRGIRMSVQPDSPALAAVRRLVVSRGLDSRFWPQVSHTVLSLPNTYEDILRSFGSTTRHNFRYYRRRFENAGHAYLDNLQIDEARLAACYLQPKCSKSIAPIDRFLRMTAAATRPLAVGLKHRNGEWLSVICGAYSSAAGVLYTQLNNDRDFPRDSLSVVLRAYLIESLIRRGMKQFVILGGTAPPLNRYATHFRTIGISIDSPDYAWRLVRGLKSTAGSWLPSKLQRWITPPP